MLLYNSRAVDPTATKKTTNAVSHLLGYCSIHHESSIRYFASGMQLNIHSDASYLSEPKANSRTGGYFYVVNKTNSPKKPLSNGPLFCHTTVLKHVVSSVAEAEFGALFVNAKEGTGTCTTLAEMGHNQDATELKTDNTTAYGIINNTVQKNAPK
jgi:hypothetical protein